MTRLQKKLWIGLVVLAVLTPLGIILPQKFNAGSAWGEWSVEVLTKTLGYVPENLRKYSDLWKAPIAQYSLGSQADGNHQIVSYIVSGFIGFAVVVLVVYLISRFLIKHEK